MTDITPITDERLAEIERGCEGVTPGPWHTEVGARYGAVVCRGDGRAIASADASEDLAAHIARLDPQTVLAIIARLRAAEERADELGDAVAAMFAKADQQYQRGLADGAEFGVEFVLSHNEVGAFTSEGMLAPINPDDWREKVSLTRKELEILTVGSREHFDARVDMWKRKATEAIRSRT